VPDRAAGAAGRATVFEKGVRTERRPRAKGKVGVSLSELIRNRLAPSAHWFASLLFAANVLIDQGIKGDGRTQPGHWIASTQRGCRSSQSRVTLDATPPTPVAGQGPSSP